MWTLEKVFVEFVTMLLLFYILVVWPRSMWDLSFLTRDGTHTPCIGRWRLNHWTTWQVPILVLIVTLFLFNAVAIYILQKTMRYYLIDPWRDYWWRRKSCHLWPFKTDMHTSLRSSQRCLGCLKVRGLMEHKSDSSDNELVSLSTHIIFMQNVKFQNNKGK